jgi:hypothetical protein
MVVASALVSGSPAFAAPGGQSDDNRAMPRETGQTPSRSIGIEESAPPTIPTGVFKRPESVEPKGNFPVTGPRPCTEDPSQPGYACE